MALDFDLSTELCGIRFKNPVWTASGCFGYGREFAPVMALRDLGAVVVKGTSAEPWAGNPGTRVTETPGGMLNAIGLQNPGVDHFLRVDWPWLQEQGATVIVNIVGKTVDEYVEVARRLEGSGVAALELNISCPNVKEGGLAFGTSLAGAAAVTAAVRKATSLPLLVKLSPNVTSIVDVAKAVEDAGADGVTVINTLLGMSIDVRRRKPVLGNTFGGLSGPAVKPVALRMVWQVAGAVKIPVVGIGGIMTGEDAVEFLMAGARAVQVGTACFVNPRAPLDVAEGIGAFMRETGVGRVAELVGAARPEGGLGAGTGSAVGAAGRGAPAPAAPGAPAPAAPGAKPPAPKKAVGPMADYLRDFLKDSDRF
ncbi:MAG: dihydroorotate dehydrogenase catalytic subunit [Symbiobacteriaceae bacterium]|nr:dihydroorotate dehydrogenase catalytic subunit [Symbiobacteriaceae bacterium]